LLPDNKENNADSPVNKKVRKILGEVENMKSFLKQS
jgi:hypothetical protein